MNLAPSPHFLMTLCSCICSTHIGGSQNSLLFLRVSSYPRNSSWPSCYHGTPASLHPYTLLGLGGRSEGEVPGNFEAEQSILSHSLLVWSLDIRPTWGPGGGIICDGYSVRDCRPGPWPAPTVVTVMRLFTDITNSLHRIPLSLLFTRLFSVVT